VVIEIGHDERVAIEYGAIRVVGPHDHMVLLPWEDGPSTVHLDVPAPDAEAAIERAKPTYAAIRERAELAPDERPQFLTVGRVAGVVTPWDRYILEAEDLREQRLFALAVVAAQMHCEHFIRYALETVAARDGTPLAKLAPGLVRSWSLTDRNGPDIFEALLGVRPTKAQCWEDYRAHVHRRNEIVHQGGEVTADLASNSVDAAVDMVRFVESALEGALKRRGRTAPGS